jgi:SAM-dependent methyltransferase/glycosyltransferase involved in cell wall biosynthesis
MKLNWFSPLPPAKTGIAAYTMRILPMLRKQAEIILWTDQTEWDSHLENYAEVRRYQSQQMPWAEVNRGHMSIYHIGNNRLFHGSIWQVSRCHPGVVVLHDRCLQNFFAGLYREHWVDRDGYVAQMERYYGQIGRQDAEMFWNGWLTIEDMVEPYPLTPLAMDNALGVLVHSEEDLNGLRAKTLCPVLYAPLPYLASPRRLERASAAGKLRAGGPPYRLIVFGYIGVNRRLDALLQAFAGLPERDRFRLEIYGQLWDDNHVRSQIRSLGLCELVTVHGFVSETELDEALSTAHLGINLRYPTMGEASLSQLQMWDHALPTLVTRVSWYAKFAETTVAFVRPNHEIKDIQAHLRAFLDDPERFVIMGQRGRRILEEQHTPQAYVQCLMDLVVEAQRFRPYSAAYDLAKRVSADMRVWTNQPAARLASYLWEQGGMVRRKMTLQKQTDRDPPQVTISQAIRDAMAEQVKRLYDEQASTLEVLQQALAAHVKRLDQMQTEILQGAIKEPYDRDYVLRFPLRVDNHDACFRYLFDFMVVANSLNLRPGAEVLDFAAGPCYVSELLNRLGYITTAFDVDHEFLAIGRERLALDPRCDIARAKFVVGDGTCLPFPDETFDGIICMNALHHMPDYRATLAEMRRILRPGGRAVFSEPGSEHSKQPESINMMRQFGVLEKDIILSEIYRLAKAVGFRRMVLKPYVSPEHVDLDYDEFPLFKDGKRVSTPYLSAQEIAEFIERFHPLFYLEKRGERPLTSATANPKLLRARIVLKQCPTLVKKGETIKVVAVCENTGQSLWLAKPRPFGGYVTFGVKLLTPAGHLFDDSKGRRLLSEDVPPGGRIEVVSEVPLEGCEAGRYRLLFDLVNEQVSWFQDIGSEVVEQWLEVV